MVYCNVQSNKYVERCQNPKVYYAKNVNLALCFSYAYSEKRPEARGLMGILKHVPDAEFCERVVLDPAALSAYLDRPMALVSVNALSMSFGGPKLLDSISFQIEPGQRICIVGRNGEGKSTLLRLLSGDLTPDSGQIARAPGLTVARLSQKVPEQLSGTVYEVVSQGLGALGKVVSDYHQSVSSADPDLARMSELESEMEEQGGWTALHEVDAAITRLGLEPEQRFENLSGGLKRRALLARAIVGTPDLLLLDEPTNHLDIDSIAWLEEFLLRHVKTLVFITHDRMFLRRIATRIIELDRGKLADWSCDYDTFLKRRDELLAGEEKTWSEFDKKLAREEVWVRQGIKARRTRNEGRVRALKELREERSRRRDRLGKANIVLQEGERSGKLVVEACGVTQSWEDKLVFANLDLCVMRGDKIGIIGPNGAGKTTLLQVLLGQVAPTSGTVRLGTNLEIAYFDQHREELNPDASVRESVADGNDVVTIGGRTRHVMGYLKDFLFNPDRANSLVRTLSGGERNRLLLARLFTRPSNLLVMDEPTNDLDAETLDLLEDRLLEYPGTLLLVSHDRAFLNNVATSVLAFEEQAQVREYVGGYDDWLRQRPQPEDIARAKAVASSLPKVEPKSATAKSRKLTFKEQRELEELQGELAVLPQQIEALEQSLEAARLRMAEPSFYKSSKDTIAAAKEQLEALQQSHAEAFGRWEAVEARLAELKSQP